MAASAPSEPAGAGAGSVSLPPSWKAAQGSLSLVQHAAGSTKGAGNKHFKAARFATALYHYHSAAFSLHGTAVCQVVDAVAPATITEAGVTAAEPLLAELRNVRASTASDVAAGWLQFPPLATAPCTPARRFSTMPPCAC